MYSWAVKLGCNCNIYLISPGNHWQNTAESNIGHGTVLTVYICVQTTTVSLFRLIIFFSVCVIQSQWHTFKPQSCTVGPQFCWTLNCNALTLGVNCLPQETINNTCSVETAFCGDSNQLSATFHLQSLSCYNNGIHLLLQVKRGIWIKKQFDGGLALFSCYHRLLTLITNQSCLTVYCKLSRIILEAREMTIIGLNSACCSFILLLFRQLFL